jgi:predicted dehydrogenase
VAILHYPDGTLGQVTSSVVHHGEEQQLVFQGQHARVSVPWKVAASVSRSNGFPEANPDLERQLQALYEGLPALVHEGHTGQIDDVLTAVERGTPVLIDGRAGKNTLQLITAIYKSASTGTTVNLPLAADDPFYTREGMLQNAIRFYEKKAHVENFADQEITTGGNYGN